jgi:hypothetical protein
MIPARYLQCGNCGSAAVLDVSTGQLLPFALWPLTVDGLQETLALSTSAPPMAAGPPITSEEEWKDLLEKHNVDREESIFHSQWLSEMPQ